MPVRKIMDVVAHFELAQYVTCPHCQLRFNVIPFNAENPNKETMIVSQRIYNDCERGKFKGMQDVETTIPKPFFFGAVGQDTENLNEILPCPGCESFIRVVESRWDYSYQRTSKDSWLEKTLRRCLCRIGRSKVKDA